MSTPPDLLEGRLWRTTRSGRAVRPPLRYEPDPDQILDDDFSDTPSDDEWGFREEEPQTEDGDADDLTDSDEGDSQHRTRTTVLTNLHRTRARPKRNRKTTTTTTTTRWAEKMNLTKWKTSMTFSNGKRLPPTRPITTHPRTIRTFNVAFTKRVKF